MHLMDNSTHPPFLQKQENKLEKKICVHLKQCLVTIDRNQLSTSTADCKPSYWHGELFQLKQKNSEQKTHIEPQKCSLARGYSLKLTLAFPQCHHHQLQPLSCNYKLLVWSFLLSSKTSWLDWMAYTFASRQQICKWDGNLIFLL